MSPVWLATLGPPPAAAADPNCTTYTSATTGSHQVCGAIRAKYLALRGPAGFLGDPITDETPTPDGVGRYNHFADDGSIYWTPETRAWSVHGAIRDQWAAMGWERSCEGYPVGDEFAIPNGRQSDFENGTITFDFTSGRATAHCRPICSSALSPSVASRLSADIPAALSGRLSTTTVAVYDRKNAVSCGLRPHLPFDAASTVKVTIVGTLLRMAQDQHRSLTAHESQLATNMIEHSDNTATDTVWTEVGRTRFQRFLGLVGMTETIPGPGPYWGLTRETADDEMKLLEMLTSTNSVLTGASRAYELNLMAHVEPDQAWGVSAGVPAGVTTHLKNGWLPRATLGWRVHSIGTFSGAGHDYMIVVLTDNDPTMGYGVDTIDNVSRVVHRDLNPAANTPVAPATGSLPVSEMPDEQIPKLPDVP